LAQGIATFAAGSNSVALGNYSTSYGNYSSAVGINSFAAGYLSLARGDCSYTYGVATSSLDLAAVAGGVFTAAAGVASQTVGIRTITTPTASAAFAAGSETMAAGKASIALGTFSQARQDYTFIFASDDTRTASMPVSTTRTGQFMVSAKGGVYIPGNVGIGVDCFVPDLSSNVLTVRGGVSAQMLMSYYTNSNQVTANNIYGYCNESIFTDGINLSGNGDRTLTMNYTNGLFVSSAPIHFALQRSAANALIFARDNTANLYRSDTGTLRTDGNLYVAGNLSAFGSLTYLDTIVSVTSALSVVNVGTGPALTVVQRGTQPIARFIDGDATGVDQTALFIENNGNIGMGTISVPDKLNIRGNTNMFRLTAASNEWYTLTANRGLSAASTDINPHLFRGVIGVNTDVPPTTSYALHIKGGNIRVDGADYSWLPGFNGSAGGYDSDGQSLFDLRSAGPNSNYNLSIATSGLGHFMKFFGGRDGDPNPFIVVKTGEPLRFASFGNFWNFPSAFTEHMRIDTQNSRVGIGTTAPEAKLTVVGAISGNNWLSAGNINLQQADVRTFTNPATATGSFLVLNINGTNRAIRLWDFTN
jgi:hypothetical protein